MAGKLVGQGSVSTPEPQSVGAIDNVSSPAVIDSLVRNQLIGMSEADRVIFLERHIEVMRTHLEKCKEKKNP